MSLCNIQICPPVGDSVIFFFEFLLVLNISVLRMRLRASVYFDVMTVQCAVVWCGVLGCRAAFC